MHEGMLNCIQNCSVCQQVKPPALPKEELCWMNKSSALFIGWSINAMGTFPHDKDRNHYPFVTIDLFYN